jgi:glucosamine-6-phosphate deaminase
LIFDCIKTSAKDYLQGVRYNVQRLQIENLKIEIYASRKEAGAAAAEAAAAELRRLARQNESIGAIFATGASQLETLRALIRIPGLPWNRIRGFHMDEYIGISADHIASFRYYMRQELTERVPMQSYYEVDGNAADSAKFCREYAEALRSANPQLCLLGIGENGHLAFNDPGVADFNDPEDMKIVVLDAECKQQQVAEGWFKLIEEVPSQAMTLTIPALLRVPKLIVSVPGSRKAKIVNRVLREPISTACPATILRTHPDATVYLNEESAVELERLRN